MKYGSVLHGNGRGVAQAAGQDASRFSSRTAERSGGGNGRANPAVGGGANFMGGVTAKMKAVDRSRDSYFTNGCYKFMNALTR